MILIPLRDDEVLQIEELESSTGEKQYRVQAGWWDEEPVDFGLEPQVVSYKEARHLREEISTDLISLLRKAAEAIDDHFYNTMVHDQELAMWEKHRK